VTRPGDRGDRAAFHLPPTGPSAAGEYISRNGILARLSRKDFGLLKPHLVAVRLGFRRRLETRNRRIDTVYFLESGLASVVAADITGQGIEVGIIGREGMTGVAVLMGGDRSPFDTFMQISGSGHCITTTHLRQCIERSDSLLRLLLRYGYGFGIQVAHTAVANGRHTVEERLARWLLMAHDRMDGEQIALTHELLALMLGVRRPGVTVALHSLEQDGLIRARRGVISILDRKGLVERSNGSYGAAEAEFRRLFGP
jgi:CRP-like cAMP-binding protein